MDRAFSNVQLKTVSEDRREFEGWASTPTTDRQSDQLMPEGARFELPLPFLLDHDHRQVVGEVYRAEVSKVGIRFWARIRKIAEPGQAKDLCDFAWQLIKNKLRPVVSVGFRPIEYERIETGGLRYTLWEWYELSGVGVAAQPEAIITGAKSARSPVVRVEVRGRKPSTPVVKLNPVAKARITGTLKINTAPRWKPGDPIKITKTGTPVVRLAREDCPWLNRPKQPDVVVKLTPKDFERAKVRVVKLRRS